ncbi:MAG TPA: T9SS type A sorting domain-containing protein [Bacteroidia bacterium]|nr:T9SS type A sorting domain-containing protein [Bacteroidia bacterium]
MKKIIFCFAFIAATLIAHSQNVIHGEYFIDSEPGFGNGTPFIITPDSDITQAISIPYSAFSNPGYHYVFMRTLDANGNWSITGRRRIEADENINSLSVIKVEYFFDVDNGFGNNSFVLVNPSTDSTWNFDIPYNQLPVTWTPNDTLFLRVQDSVKTNWSITTMIDSLNFTMVGINELAEVSGLSVYPNPFSNELTVTVKGKEKVQIAVLNEAGQVMSGCMVEQSAKINTEHYAAGTYTIYIWDKNHKRYGSKIIKQ